MPYSHLPQMGRERFEESSHLKMANCLDNLASVPDHELVELVWENGQVVMQGGQSNKTRKSSPSNVFSSHGYKAQGKDEGDCVLPKLERFGNGDAAVNDFSSSGHMGLGQDDELARWLNYPLDDYCSDFFSELTGVNQNAVSTQNNAPQANQVGRDSRRGSTNGGVNSEIGNASKVAGEGHDHSRARGNYMGSSVLQQCQTSVPSHRSRVSEFSGRSAQPSHYGASNQTPPASTDVMPNSKIHMQEREAMRLPPKPSNNTGFTNFSHFLRPATFDKSNQRTVAAAAGPDFLSKDRIQSNNKASVASSSNAIESTVMGSNTVSRSIAGSQSRHIPLPGKVDMKSSTHNPSKESESVCQEDAFSKNKSSNQTLGRTLSFTASTAAGRTDTDKGIEPVVASSSVCSGNSTGGASNDPRLELKRKSRETEEAESPSEDVEEESVGARKPTTGRGGSGTKRSRAAEVHNLSERKRRDRINEKMRALQELIPNCNKVDKASMLDEAIEYLKTLQLQVQIMSMGTGLYMPPMMLPNGMQHMHASFSPMSVGMGMGMSMGMGFGMGMFNVGGGSSSCPLIQPPPMLGAHFPGPPISGPSGMPMMSGSNHPIFGLPGEGQPMSMPRVPYDPLSGGSSASLPVVSGVSTSLHTPSSFVVPCQKDPLSNINTQTLKTHAECLQNHLSIQDQATEGRDQSALVHRNDQPPQATDNRVNASLL